MWLFTYVGAVFNGITILILGKLNDSATRLDQFFYVVYLNSVICNSCYFGIKIMIKCSYTLTIFFPQRISYCLVYHLSMRRTRLDCHLIYAMQKKFFIKKIYGLLFLLFSFSQISLLIFIKVNNIWIKI